MSPKLLAAATAADAQVCNALVPPLSGCNAGGGIHIVIPPDFAARIAAGQDVPGCTYAQVQADGSLQVDDRTQALLATPAAVQALAPALQTKAAALTSELATAVTVGSAQVADAQLEKAP